MTRAHPRRPRSLLIIGMMLVIASGLASRRFPHLLPSILGQYPGDALWALMVFLGIAILRPRLPPLRLALSALAICYVVEFSQLYQAPWINSFRESRVGHLILGSAFHWPDLLAYAVGVSLGFVVDRCIFARQRPAIESKT